MVYASWEALFPSTPPYRLVNCFFNSVTLVTIFSDAAAISSARNAAATSAWMLGSIVMTILLIQERMPDADNSAPVFFSLTDAKNTTISRYLTLQIFVAKCVRRTPASSSPPHPQADHLIPFPTSPPPRYLFWLFRRPNDFAIVRRFVPKRAVVAFPALSANEIRACALCSAHVSNTGEGTGSQLRGARIPMHACQCIRFVIAHSSKCMPWLKLGSCPSMPRHATPRSSSGSRGDHRRHHHLHRWASTIARPAVPGECSA